MRIRIGSGRAAVVMGLLVLALAGCDGTRTIDAGGIAASVDATTTVAPPPTDGSLGTSTTGLPATTPPTTRRSGTTATTSPATGTPATGSPATTSVPPTPGPGGNRHAAGWESYSVSADGRTLVFTYYAGIAPCSVFDSIAAAEGPAQVTVTIYERSDAAPDVACIAIAQEKSASVTLTAALGGRTVVDGSR